MIAPIRPLAHDGGGVRARRQIGEQQLHVPGADFLAVDPVVGACAAFDAPRDLDFLERVVRGRRVLGLVVQQQRHFGQVPRRALGRSAEDDVVHFAAAHPLGRGFPHHPAQSLDHVRLAAAVRPDDPGDAGVDHQFDRIDERLKAAQF